MGIPAKSWVRPWMVWAFAWAMFPLFFVANLRHAWLWACDDVASAAAQIDFNAREGQD